MYFTNKQSTQKYTSHTPKWSHLYSYSKIDFSWFLKCFAMFYSFVQRIPKRRSTISNCTIRKHFLCLILSISCWVILCLNMFEKIGGSSMIWVMSIHKYTKIEPKCILYIKNIKFWHGACTDSDFENRGPVWLLHIIAAIWHRPDFWSLNISSKYIFHVLSHIKTP